MERIFDSGLLEKYAGKLNLHSRFDTWDQLTKHLLHFKKGEIVKLCGESVDTLYLLVDGDMEFLCINEDDEIYLSYRVQDDWLFYDVEYITGGPAASQSDIMKDSWCIAFPKKENEALLSQDFLFHKYMVHQLTEKLEIRRVSTLNRKSRSIRERLASYLLTFEPGDSIKSFSEVARLLNCSYRQLKRVVLEFCGQEILEQTGRGTFVLVNKDAMLTYVKERGSLAENHFGRADKIKIKTIRE